MTEAEAERDAAITARRDLLVSGDLGDTKAHAAADRRVAESERKIGALSDAIGITAKRREDAERDLAQACDRAAREREDAWVQDRVQQIEQASTAYEAASKPLIGALHQVRSFHGNQLALHVQQMHGGLREANVTGVGALIRDLKIYGANLLAGRVSIEKKMPLENAKAA